MFYHSKRVNRVFRHDLQWGSDLRGLSSIGVDKGGWVNFDDLGRYMNLPNEQLLCILALSTKLRQQVAAVREREDALCRVNHVRFVRATQGHSLVHIDPRRIFASVGISWFTYLPTLVHVTDAASLAGIMQFGIAPGYALGEMIHKKANRREGELGRLYVYASPYAPDSPRCAGGVRTDGDVVVIINSYLLMKTGAQVVTTASGAVLIDRPVPRCCMLVAFAPRNKKQDLCVYDG